MSAARIYVPATPAAVACGADEVAAAMIARRAEAQARASTIVRNGSRGLYWLEPLVEVETPEGRIGYGPVEPGDVRALLDARPVRRRRIRLRIGLPEDHPFLKRQTRLTFARCGIIDPLSLDDYRAHGGCKGLERALALGAEAIVEEVDAIGPARPRRRRLSDRHQVEDRRATPRPTQKYIVCNADEGDSGTFADRMMMEGDPFVLIEGMAIAGIAVGATKGYIYIRSEYPHAIAAMDAAIALRASGGMLGTSVAGSAFAFDLEVRVGAGAYVCGEETSLLESLEGKRGVVRAKPPLPAHKGLFGRPTVINNVLSLAAVPIILAKGAAVLPRLRHGPLARHHADPARRQHQAWRPVRDRLRHHAGRTGRRHRRRHRSGRPVRAVQVGGPLGAYFPRALFDTPFDYEAFAARDGLIGHGGIVVFDDTVDMAQQARFAMEFCAIEILRQVHALPHRLDARRRGHRPDHRGRSRPRSNLDVLEDLCDTMKFGSLCALGGFTPYPVMSALTHFPEDFGARPRLQAAE